MKNTVVILCLVGVVFSQKVKNVEQKIENGRVIIIYDLIGGVNKTYDIIITAEKDGKTVTPRAIAGDLTGIKTGTAHEIWWEPVLEARDLQGWTISLEAIETFDMVFVKGGTFEMGSNYGDSDEKPIHTVMVSDFYMSTTEVTQKQWKAVMGDNPSNWKGDNLPVETVSWNDIQKFLKKLNQQSGKNYRLPTEAEWEYAARGGNKSRGYKYAGSNNISEVAWYSGNSGNRTHPVGQKQPNELGLYDMCGNVWEWCNDWYDKSYYKNSPETKPQGGNSGPKRVLRGGSRFDDTWYCRVADRGGNFPGYWGYVSGGFRLVRPAL